MSVSCGLIRVKVLFWLDLKIKLNYFLFQMKHNIWTNFNPELFPGGRDNISLNASSPFSIERKLLLAPVVSSTQKSKLPSVFLFSQNFVYFYCNTLS